MQKLLATLTLAAVAAPVAATAAPATATATELPLTAHHRSHDCSPDEVQTRDKFVIRNRSARTQTVSWSASVVGDPNGAFDTGTYDLQIGLRKPLVYDHSDPIEVTILKGSSTAPKRVLHHGTYQRLDCDGANQGTDVR